MKTNLFVLCSLLCTIVLGQKHKTDWNRYGLKGKVKELRDVYYDHIDTSATAAVHTLDPAKGWVTTYVFDSNGYLERETFYGKELLESVWIYAYSAPGIISHKTTYSKYGSGGLKFYLREDDSTAYLYDKKGNEISEDVYNPNGKKPIAKYSYSYDNKGNQITLTVVDIEFNILGHYRYKYDSAGNCIEAIKEGDCQGCANASKSVRKYDKNGMMVEDIEYGSEFDKAFRHKSVFRYDQYGNVTDAREYKHDGTPLRNVSYTYTYDKKGNWVTKIYYENEKIEPFYEVRELTYYK